MLLGRPWCFLNHNNQCSQLLPRLNDVLVTILVISIIISRKLFYLKIKLKLLLSTLQWLTLRQDTFELPKMVGYWIMYCVSVTKRTQAKTLANGPLEKNSNSLNQIYFRNIIIWVQNMVWKYDIVYINYFVRKV